MMIPFTNEELNELIKIQQKERKLWAKMTVIGILTIKLGFKNKKLYDLADKYGNEYYEIYEYLRYLTNKHCI